MLTELFKFAGISGLGWILDFTLYSIMTLLFGVKVGYANFFSAMPAVTFVFIMSTQNIFKQSNRSGDLKYKYLIYCLYQVFLVFLVSIAGQYLYDYISMVHIEITNIDKLYKIGVKLAITPITMTVNFFVMKILLEKC